MSDVTIPSPPVRTLDDGTHPAQPPAAPPSSYVPPTPRGATVGSDTNAMPALRPVGFCCPAPANRTRFTTWATGHL
jgi:hypothetical protein